MVPRRAWIGLTVTQDGRRGGAHWQNICAAVLIFCVLESGRASINRSRDPRSILLRAETINVHTHVAQPAWGGTSTLRSSGDRKSDVRTFLVHMDDAGDALQQRAVREAAGQRLERYVPHNTFLLDLSPEALHRTRALVGTSVVWMGELQPHHKLDTAALQKLDGERSADSGKNGGEGVMAATAPDVVLIAKLRSPNAANLAHQYERALLLAGLPATVKAAGRNKLHVRRVDRDADMAATGKPAVEGRGAGTFGRGDMRERWAYEVGIWLSEERDVLWVEPKARIKVR